MTQVVFTSGAGAIIPKETHGVEKAKPINSQTGPGTEGGSTIRIGDLVFSLALINWTEAVLIQECFSLIQLRRRPTP